MSHMRNTDDLQAMRSTVYLFISTTCFMLHFCAHLLASALQETIAKARNNCMHAQVCPRTDLELLQYGLEKRFHGRAITCCLGMMKTKSGQNQRHYMQLILMENILEVA